MLIALVTDLLDPAARLAAFEAELARERLDAGAVVSFTGRVRREDGNVLGLMLEAYPGFTETAIRTLAQDVAEKRGLTCVHVLHRVGTVAPGECVVFVAAAAKHRREAFEGADQIMDFLKSRAPFWKKSLEAEGEHWIEPRPQDYLDAARWD